MSWDCAADRIAGKIPDTKVEKISYLKPKIMICNVHTEEEDLGKDDKNGIITKIIEKNYFFQSVDDIESKMKFLFMRPSAAKTNHLILRWEPEVCKLMIGVTKLDSPLQSMIFMISILLVFVIIINVLAILRRTVVIKMRILIVVNVLRDMTKILYVWQL